MTSMNVSRFSAPQLGMLTAPKVTKSKGYLPTPPKTTSVVVGMDRSLSENAIRLKAFNESHRPNRYKHTDDLFEGRVVHLDADGRQGCFDSANNFVLLTILKMRAAGKFRQPTEIVRTPSRPTNVPYDSKNHANGGGKKKNQEKQGKKR